MQARGTRFEFSIQSNPDFTGRKWRKISYRPLFAGADSVGTRQRDEQDVGLNFADQGKVGVENQLILREGFYRGSSSDPDPGTA